LSAFGITPASTTVPLDDARHGIASFTVTNQLGRPVRAVASVTVTGGPAPSTAWLSGPDRPERELAVDAADQFTVEVTVPEGVPGGTYAFRLDVVSVTLPEEEFAHGPDVTYQVPEPPVIVVEPPPVVKPPPGYVETVAGALGGAVVGGAATGLVGGILTAILAFIDQGGAAIVVLVLTIAAVIIGVWVGAALGINVLLRQRRLDGPLWTAIPFGILLPIWAIVVLVVLVALDLRLSGIVGLVVGLVVVVIMLIPPALLARAIRRFRSTGGL
jgi:hypothetical protein